MSIIIIWSNGDSSVGIPGNSVEIELGFDIHDKNDKEFLNYYRNKFKEIYYELWDEKVYVLYDFEYEEMIKQEDEIYK